MNRSSMYVLSSISIFSDIILLFIILLNSFGMFSMLLRHVVQIGTIFSLLYTRHRQQIIIAHITY